MGLEILLPTLFLTKALALVVFATHQIHVTKRR